MWISKNPRHRQLRDSMKWAALIGMLAMTTACSSGDTLAECLDAGADDGCFRGSSDGGPEPLAPNLPEDGGPEFNLADDDGVSCAALTSKTCGFVGGPNCTGAPGCEAARLLARYERESCDEALSNEVTFPACEEGTCTELVDKVCGTGGTEGACAASSSCGPVLELLGRSASGVGPDHAAAEDACRAALADDTLFPQCMEAQ